MLKLTLNFQRRFIIRFIEILGLIFLIRNGAKTKIDLAKVKKILVIELWGIGDIVTLTPALIALRNQMPNSQIVLLSKEHAIEIMRYSSLVDKIITYNFPWTKFKGKYKLTQWDFRSIFRLIKKLRSESFDLSLDARGDFRNNLLSFFIGAKRRLGYNWTGGGCFLTDAIVLDYRDKHRLDAWVGLLDHLGVKVNNRHPRFYLDRKEEEWSEIFLKNNGLHNAGLLVSIHPGASIKTRRWPLPRFIEVAEFIRNKYNAKVIIFEESEGYGQDIAIRGVVRAKVTLREMAALIKKSDLLICNDGGPMHIASAVDTPVIAIFGPQDPVVFGPYGANNTVVIQENVECRGCFDYCKFKEPFCINNISAEDVIDKVDNKLQKYRILMEPHPG